MVTALFACLLIQLDPAEAVRKDLADAWFRHEKEACYWHIETVRVDADGRKAWKMTDTIVRLEGVLPGVERFEAWTADESFSTVSTLRWTVTGYSTGSMGTLAFEIEASFAGDRCVFKVLSMDVEQAPKSDADRALLADLEKLYTRTLAAPEKPAWHLALSRMALTVEPGQPLPRPGKWFILPEDVPFKESEPEWRGDVLTARFNSVAVGPGRRIESIRSPDRGTFKRVDEKAARLGVDQK